jgi:hypothetical protein
VAGNNEISLPVAGFNIEQITTIHNFVPAPL